MLYRPSRKSRVHTATQAVTIYDKTQSAVFRYYGFPPSRVHTAATERFAFYATAFYDTFRYHAYYEDFVLFLHDDHVLSNKSNLRNV